MCKLVEQAVVESIRLNKLSGVPKELTCSKDDYDNFLSYIKENWGVTSQRSSICGLKINIKD